ncbi:hypothetical protein SAMN05444008_106246 [Cnuella takakiae]|uniref:Uncharacterized protein n=1 Tax=Cnuella takakiae TaxID=1302690 RepID=A0A1M5AFN8_9BACT|nr:hypothetical protein BUE76_08775 [Cnuella takakiae]SHF29120.1 hypothetical protein SAMN05444008_106246 [Cnuella takakiae]
MITGLQVYRLPNYFFIPFGGFGKENSGVNTCDVDKNAGTAILFLVIHIWSVTFAVPKTKGS